MVRREEDGIRRYVHLGTGNYNDSTARLYTDCGIMTCHPEIGEDATAVFNMLSGYSEPLTWNMLAVAPCGSEISSCGSSDGRRDMPERAVRLLLRPR